MGNDTSTAPGLPGLRDGTTPTDGVATKPAPVADGGLGGNKKPLFGGNVGKKPGKPLPPGMVAGSPEHEQWKRDNEAQRKRDERAAKAAALPPPLPPASSPVGETPMDTMPPSSGFDPVPLVAPDVVWRAEDFNDCAPELVDLAEAWRVNSRTKQAVDGKLLPKVVKEIAADTAFPASVKKSLSRTSPATLADFFNSIGVPIRFKKYVTTAPLMIYLIVRDMAVGSRIDKLVSDQNEEALKAKAAPGPSQPPPQPVPLT